MHGAGGIGRYELHVYLAAFALIAAAVFALFLFYNIKDFRIPFLIHEEIDKAGAGNLYLIKIAAVKLCAPGHRIGYHPGCFAQLLSRRERKG